MSETSPLLLLLLLGVSGYAAKLWWDDYVAAHHGTPNPRPLPGATACSGLAITVAILGALVLLAAETWGEYRLGLVSEQSSVTVLFGLYTLAAAFVEELIFRGFIVAENRGRAALIASVVGASVVFALAHPFLWAWKEGELLFQFTPKAWFSTGAIFVGSLWFYTVRFWSLNPLRSLWPCIAAHAAKNLGVLGIKYAQGFVSGWW